MALPKRKPGRKPVDIIASAVKPEGRDVIWSHIRQQREFTYRSIQDATDIPNKTIRDYVFGLQRAGYLERLEDGDNHVARYRLIRDIGVHAPRVRKDGSEVQQGRANDAMWSAMRLLTHFSPRDLALHASSGNVDVSEEHAKQYCKHLAKAGYIKAVSKGTPAGQAVYRFLRFTGPKAPMIQQVRQVFDPNTGEVVWPRPGSGGAK